MMELSLTEPERQLLDELIKNELVQLRSQHYHAESHAVKVLLKDKAQRLEELHDRLSGARQAAIA